MTIPTFTMRQLVRGWNSLWSPHTKMESKNGRVYFWRKK